MMTLEAQCRAQLSAGASDSSLYAAAAGCLEARQVRRKRFTTLFEADPVSVYYQLDPGRNFEGGLRIIADNLLGTVSAAGE